MNILIISPDFNFACGVSKHVFELLKHFDSKKEYTVYFITNGGDALSKLDKHSIEYTLLRFSKGWRNIFYLVYNYFRLKSFCIKNKIDIIHTHHRYPELLSTIIAKRLNIKTITTVHSLVEGYKNLSFKSDKIIAVSNAVKQTLLDYFNVSSNKICAMYNCLMPLKETDEKQIKKLTKELNLKENDFVILFLGRINKVKGIDVLIESFLEIRSVYSNVKLILLGSIMDKTLYKINTDFNENIFVLSEQSQVSFYYKISDIVVLPSRVESLGYTMLEAGYFKKPFIGSRTGGIEEFIEDGVNGFLFQPGNADDLADKIRFVINNPEKAKSASEELHKKVKKSCNCEEYFEKLTNIYNELLNEQ